VVVLLNKKIMETHWRKLKNEKYLGSWDLEKDGKFIIVTVTIDKIFNAEMTGQMGKQQKTFIKFKEFQKQMIMNTTNFKRLENQFKIFDPNQFIGKQVYLNVEKVDSPEGKVDALRFLSKEVKSASDVKKTLSDERFDDALKSIIEKTFTKDDLLKKFQLSDDQLTKLETI